MKNFVIIVSIVVGLTLAYGYFIGKSTDEISVLLVLREASRAQISVMASDGEFTTDTKILEPFLKKYLNEKIIFQIISADESNFKMNAYNLDDSKIFSVTLDSQGKSKITSSDR